MLAITENGNLAEVRRELTKDGWNIGDFVDYGAFNPHAAEIVPGITPLWHLIETHPNQERTAAGHLIARRFGVFIPETEEDLVRRGRKLHVTRPMFSGYIFVFVWSVMKHINRIESCPGVARIIFVDDEPDRPRRPAVISDKKIDEIRAVENSKRPLPMIMLDENPDISKKKKVRRRNTPKTERERQIERGNDVMCCRPWSAFQDSLLTLDSDGRNHALLNALGLS